MKRILAVGRITAPEPAIFVIDANIREIKVIADVGRKKPLYSKILVANRPDMPAEGWRSEMAEARQRVFDSTATYDQENPQ